MLRKTRLAAAALVSTVLALGGSAVATVLPPVADAGDDQTVEWVAGGVPVTLDGSGTSGGYEPLTFDWSDDFVEGTASGEMPTVTFDSLGCSTVTLTVTDGFGQTDSDTVEICVEDTTPPEVGCVESVNPHGSQVPKAGRSNEDGFYQLLALDGCDPDPFIFVADPNGPEVFGPFGSGNNVKITEAPGGRPSIRPMGSGSGQAGAVAFHIRLTGEAIVFATDASGNTSDNTTCLVPPLPK